MSDDLFIDDLDIDVSMEAQFIPYDRYFKSFGVRRLGQFTAPKFTPINKMVLPRAAILHYIPESEAEMGMDQNHILLTDTTRLIMVNHHETLTSLEGAPRRLPTPAMKLIKEYLRRNRKTRQLHDIQKAVQDEKTVIIENYGILNHLYRYRENVLTPFWRWKNVQLTAWNRAAELTSQVDRNQYFIIRLPKQIPSISDFKRAEATPNRMTLKNFQSEDAMTLLDIWTWLGEHRSKSNIAKVPDSQMNKIHLIVVESGVWSVLNLGILNDWRATTSEEIEAGAEKHAGLDATNVQKYFLRFVNSMLEYRNGGDKTASPILDEVIKEEVHSTDQSVVDTDKLPDTSDVVANDIDNSELNKGGKKVILPSGRKDGVGDIAANSKAVERNKKIQLVAEKPPKEVKDKLTRELDSMDELFDEEYVNKTHADKLSLMPPLERGIMRKADDLADAGLISTGQYRRMGELATRYKSIPNPFGEGTLETLATVTSEDVQLPKLEPQADDPLVLDKSMLNTVIEEMDRKYNTEILEKDVAAAVLNFQKAGVAVTKYEVENIVDALNDYNAYTVRLVPINGNATVVRFRLPKIQEDGTYRINGIRCNLRKQRVDVPIRKVDSGKVALTSYYSKLFVTRSEKTVHNFERWLHNAIVAKLNEPNSIIRKVVYSNTWDNNFIAPRIYSIIAKTFGSFDVGEYHFNFDFGKRKEIYGENILSIHEKEGRIVVGTFNTDGVVVVDNNDEFYAIEDKEESPLGKITDILQIDETKSPLEIVEVSILNKTIPLGIVLCYMLGINNLIKLSGVQVRRALTGERLQLDADEFAIKFIDETLIFDKHDKKAVMLFGGFHPYREVIRGYAYSTLNRKDIFYNILDSHGIGLRYIREMDLLQDMWVDPITEGLLKEMNEPTELVGLFMRSLELLMTDWSPDETDIYYQRIRGYERFSGFVYQEMVKSMRQFSAMSASSSATVELHPEAVWRAIDKDVSKYLIQESNPIHNLKEKEIVTFSGQGGRGAESMVKRSRVFHKHDLGVISEATTDNKSVGIVSYMTPNPSFTNLRGTVSKENKDLTKSSSLLSTSCLVSPCSDMDD